MRIVGGWVLAGLVAIQYVAAQDISVVKSGAVKTPIDLSGIVVSESAMKTFSDVIAADLVRSGWFGIEAGAAVMLEARALPSSGVGVACRAMNRGTGAAYFSREYRDTEDGIRRIAHRVADDLVMSVKGRKGIASTRIVVVGRREGNRDLFLCDADGANMAPLTLDGALCLAPKWLPDGKGVVYTSFLTGFPDIYVLDLARGARRKLAGYPGMNASPAVSPDGRSLALVLSKDGNPELYVQDLVSGRLSRLTRTAAAAEASPSWSPDGKSLAYVSDGTGAPQVYVVGARGGRSKRLTLYGAENVAPDWGPDGRLAYSSRRGGDTR